jgi:hypothetical protein
MAKASVREKAEAVKDTVKDMTVVAFLVPSEDVKEFDYPDSAIVLGNQRLDLTDPSISKTGRSLTLGNIGPRDAEREVKVDIRIGDELVKGLRVGYGMNMYLTSQAVKSVASEDVKAALRKAGLTE